MRTKLHISYTLKDITNENTREKLYADAYELNVWLWLCICLFECLREPLETKRGTLIFVSNSRKGEGGGKIISLHLPTSMVLGAPGSK